MGIRLGKHAASALAGVAFAASSLIAAPAVAQAPNPVLLPPPSASSTAQAAPQVAPEPGTPYSPGDAAFEEALRSIAPLSPDQVEQMRRRLDAVDRATVTPLSDVRPVTRSISASFASGERPPTVRVAPGWVSTLTFSDVTGQPWPVQVVTEGNPDAYTVQSAGGEQGSNIVMISARQAHVPSNIAITLQGARVPLLLTLDPTASDVDFRVDVRVDQRGPNASYEGITGSSLPATGDSTMLAFLDGVPPEGARRLTTGAGDVQAWFFDDMLYVRTARSVLSPAYVGKQSNASGTNVYVMSQISAVVVSDGGRMSTVTISR